LWKEENWIIAHRKEIRKNRSIARSHRLTCSCVRLSAARERATNAATARVRVRNVSGRRIGAETKDCKADDEDDCVEDREGDVLLGGVPLALLDELEPEEGRPVEGEAGDEERRYQSQQGVEEGDRLGDDPGDDGDGRDQREPDGPAGFGVDVLDRAVGEDAAHDITADDDAVDGAGDEDDGERDAECDARHLEAGGQEGGAVDIDTDKGVDESAGKL
jgi:hypothetical protein